jgi:hypothetical protein
MNFTLLYVISYPIFHSWYSTDVTRTAAVVEGYKGRSNGPNGLRFVMLLLPDNGRSVNLRNFVNVKYAPNNARCST